MTTSGRPELVDVVDEHDAVVGTVTRATMRADRLRHRCVFIAVVHPDGRLLVHQRSDAKDVWPGWWDLAVGGVVTAGESYDVAARRELWEEVGIDAVPHPIGGGAYDDETISVIGRCYRVEHAGPFTFHDGEVVRAEWADLETIGRDERQFLPDSTALLLPLLRGR
ncbi:MAG: NUDIX domain-containing protein [Actinobacteria bacterium]|nr:NUDIX domain-containing protein [Actinomycetota bacterium]